MSEVSMRKVRMTHRPTTRVQWRYSCTCARHHLALLSCICHHPSAQATWCCSVHQATDMRLTAILSCVTAQLTALGTVTNARCASWQA
jgi:hypothetical protein